MNTTHRHNVYILIHKALRACMADVLVAVGRMDPHDPDDVAWAAASVRNLLDFARNHLQHEEDWIHPALEARRAGSSAETRADHLQHREAFEMLEASLRAVESSTDAGREAAALRLYRHLALFVADNLQHMHVEETENHATLIECYSEQELLAIEDRIVGSHTPAEMAAVMRWMVPAANAPERAGLLAGIRQNAPRPAFEAILAQVRPLLSARDRAKLDAAIDALSTATDVAASEPARSGVAELDVA
jgi:Hemerythrin HHE cation binding domain